MRPRGNRCTLLQCAQDQPLGRDRRPKPRQKRRLDLWHMSMRPMSNPYRPAHLSRSSARAKGRAAQGTSSDRPSSPIPHPMPPKNQRSERFPKSPNAQAYQDDPKQSDRPRVRRDHAPQYGPFRCRNDPSLPPHPRPSHAWSTCDVLHRRRQLHSHHSRANQG